MLILFKRHLFRLLGNRIRSETVESKPYVPRRKRLSRLLAYFVALQVILFLGAVTYVGSLLLDWDNRGFTVFWHSSIYSFLPLFKYKDITLTLFCIWKWSRIENLQVNLDDIFLVTYPRSGTTRLQEIIYLIASNLDFETAKTKRMDERFPFLDDHDPGIETMPSPRLIKTHLPYRILPLEVKKKKPKIIYCARNVKDVLVSRYLLHSALAKNWITFSLEDFYSAFIENKLQYGPWWRHVLEFWNRRHDKNILFLTYEDMNQNIEENIRKISNFLGRNLSDTNTRRIKEYVRIDNMRENKAANFEWFHRKYPLRNTGTAAWIRKGKVGDWKAYLTPQMAEALDKMMVTHFQGTGLKFQDSESNTVPIVT